MRHSSLYQNLDPRQREWTTVEERDAHDTRTPAQIESYRRGLHTLALWFLHPSTYTFLFGAPDDNPRFVWSFWERRVAELVSPQHACVDLALFRSEVKYDQRNWLSIFGSSVVELCSSERRPPLTPEQFNAELRRFDRSDRHDWQLASQLYREALLRRSVGAAAHVDRAPFWLRLRLHDGHNLVHDRYAPRAHADKLRPHGPNSARAQRPREADEALAPRQRAQVRTRERGFHCAARAHHLALQDQSQTHCAASRP